MIKHYYQPTNVSCVQGATAMLLSAFGIDKSPDDILLEVPTRPWPGTDEPAGTPNQDAAAYMCKLGLDVTIISFDTWITDQSWTDKDISFIEERLKMAAGKLTAPLIGRQGTELYIQAYLDFIGVGGKLSVEVAPSTEQLKQLIAEYPIMLTVAYNTLHGAGKSVNGPGLYESHEDDIEGRSPNHNIVLTQYRDNKFEYYDPWKKPGIHWVEPDHLIAAIATAQQECDNMIILVRPRD